MGNALPNTGGAAPGSKRAPAEQYARPAAKRQRSQRTGTQTGQGQMSAGNQGGLLQTGSGFAPADANGELSSDLDSSLDETSSSSLSPSSHEDDSSDGDGEGIDGDERPAPATGEDVASDDSSDFDPDPAALPRPRPSASRNQSWTTALNARSSRLEKFLARMAASNAEIEQEKVNGTLSKRDIENVGEGEEHIEMNLGLGVLEEKGEDESGEEESEEDEDDGDGAEDADSGASVPNVATKETNRLGKLMGKSSGNGVGPGIEVVGNQTRR